MNNRRSGNRRSGHRRSEKRRPEPLEWTPRTKLGRQVAAKEIKSIDEIFDSGMVIKEPEIVDTLLPDLEESVIAIGKAGRPFKMVQRMTDSGRRNNFQVIVAIGNKDGYVGLGEGRAKEYGPSLRKAIKDAKTNLMRIPRGCGSWQCSCGGSHTVPFRVEGRSGSVKIVLKPAPRGIGLAASKTSKNILTLAGYSDIWAKSFGRTSARVNLAKATFDALRNLSNIKAAELEKYHTKRKTLGEEVEELRDLSPEDRKPEQAAEQTADAPNAETKSESKPEESKPEPKEQKPKEQTPKEQKPKEKKDAGSS